MEVDISSNRPLRVKRLSYGITMTFPLDMPAESISARKYNLGGLHAFIRKPTLLYECIEGDRNLPLAI